jgi:hypothetical protein
MRKTSLFISAAMASLTVVGFASTAKADRVVIMTKNPCGFFGQNEDVGHAAMAFYDDENGTVSTKGMWPKDSRYPENVRTDDPTDLAMARGEGCGLVTRTAYVTPARRIWAQKQVATPGSTTCYRYSPIAKINAEGTYIRIFNSTGCSCVNFANRVWKKVTGREVFSGKLTPEGLGKEIMKSNGGSASGDFDGGNVWK